MNGKTKHDVTSQKQNTSTTAKKPPQKNQPKNQKKLVAVSNDGLDSGQRNLAVSEVLLTNNSVSLNCIP